MPSPLRISTWTVRARGNPFIALVSYGPVYVDDGREPSQHCIVALTLIWGWLTWMVWFLLAAKGDERAARVGGC
jgi:threonine/homoserine/homoserine lactone efflux protein